MTGPFIRHAFRRYTSDKEFSLWALGDVVNKRVVKLLEVPALWNELHGDKLHIKPDDFIEITLPKMYDIYIEEKERNGVEPD